MTNLGRNQRGGALMVIVMALAMTALACMTLWSHGDGGRSPGSAPSPRVEYLATVGQQILGWYRRHASEADGAGESFDDAWTEKLGRVADLGVQSKWALRIAASSLLQDRGVGYRVLIAWLPGPQGEAPDFDPRSGRVANHRGLEYVLVDGRLAHQAAAEFTRAALDTVARAFEARFRASYIRDPDADIGRNWFRAVDCQSPGLDELPCADAFAPMSGDLATRLGLPVEPVSGWGGPVEWTNGVEASSKSPPYSVEVRAQTPWGTWMQRTAIQVL